MNTYIIIPTYNERENIRRMLTELFALRLDSLTVCVVDDHSPDGTAEVVRELQKNPDYTIHLTERPGKLGLGTAYIAGFTHALAQHADVIFEMDADGSHNPQDVPRLLAEIERGADVAIGSRRISGGSIHGWNAYRHAASWGAMTLARILLRLSTHDVTAGFRAYRRSVLERIDLKAISSNGYAFQEEMIWFCERRGFNVAEVPITFKDREIGESKLSRKEIVEFFMTLTKLILFQSKHLRRLSRTR